jgi:hypothetical protein
LRIWVDGFRRIWMSLNKKRTAGKCLFPNICKKWFLPTFQWRFDPVKPHTGHAHALIYTMFNLTINKVKFSVGNLCINQMEFQMSNLKICRRWNILCQK